MKKLSLITLLTLMMTVVSLQGAAQNDSSVLITTIKYGRDITLQVVAPDYTVSSEKYKFKKDEPDQMILKREMDKWLRKGYYLTNTYAYSITSGTISGSYVNYILIKKEE